MPNKQKLVVIGNGMAGARFVEEVLARGGGNIFDIVIFGEEPRGNYNRILLSSLLAGVHRPEDIFINDMAWYEENGVVLHAGVKAIQIDRRLQQVYGSGQVIESYDKLVLATGSIPFVPPIDGIQKEGVFVFRSIDDCDAIIDYSGRVKKAVVIGGGLLGLEAARGLLERGMEVAIVHLMPHLMETQLDFTAGTMLKNILERMGVRVHLEKRTSAVLGDERVEGLAFTDGSTLDCDMVVVSAGVQANTALAKQAGLHVERGIVVHNDLSCRNDSNVYAIGECAQHRGTVYGLVAPLWEQGQVLADILTGADPGSAYRGSQVSTKLKVMGVELATMGEKDAKGEEDEEVTYIEPSRGVYKKAVVRDGRLVGAILLGDGLIVPRIFQAFDRGEDLPEARAELLFPWARERVSDVITELPNTARICHCNGVSKGAIVDAVESGHCTVKAICEATRAGTGCGSCKSDIQAIIEQVSSVLEKQESNDHLKEAIPLLR